MNIDFNAAFDAGLTEEQIMEMMKDSLNKAKDERAQKEAAKRAEEEKKAAEQRAKDKSEEYKAEGRAYLINALIAYSVAFGLEEEDTEWSDEDIAEAEAFIKRLEAMAPLYIQMYKMKNELDEDFFGGLGLGGL